MKSSPEPFDAARITACTWVDEVHFFESIDSTNTTALAYARQATPPALPQLFLAEEQTAGRGRGRNRWWSSSGALTFSALTRPIEVDSQQTPLVSLTVGLALCRAIESFAPGEKVQLKWPNDVFLGGRKLGGVLIELPADLPQQFVIGVGLNVGNSLTAAPPEIRLTAASLADLPATSAIDRNDVLIAALQHIGERLAELETGSSQLAPLWRQYSFLTGRNVVVEMPRTTIEGPCLGIADDGGLVVDTLSGPKTCYGGVVKQFR